MDKNLPLPGLPEIARLRELISESGLTTYQVADRVEMSQGEISRLLSGRRSPSLMVFRRVLLGIGASWSDLDAGEA